jgi:hypothetical protein
MSPDDLQDEHPDYTTVRLLDELIKREAAKVLAESETMPSPESLEHMLKFVKKLASLTPKNYKKLFPSSDLGLMGTPK